LVDVLIAGGGPVGLAAGIRAARAGLEVVIAEPRTPPIDKACGEGLMPGALWEFEHLGVPIDAGRAFTGVCYRQGASHVAADFPSGPGRGVRRTDLHEALRAAAVDAGVRWIPARIESVESDADGVTADGHRARWLLVADGLGSRIAAHLGLASPKPRHPRFGVRRHFAVTPWSDRVEVHWSPRAEAYITPVADDQVGVALLFSGKGRFDDLIADFPALVERLGDPISGTLGAGPFWRVPRRRTLGRTLLIGDAAGFLDPLTGEGLRHGLASARLAVQAICDEAPERYERAWPRLIRRYRWLTAALLFVAHRPWTRRRIVPVAQRCPWMFRRVVHMLSE
jgi:flavin-dependent dehydrogenase